VYRVSSLPPESKAVRIVPLTALAFALLTGCGLLFAVQNWITGGPGGSLAWPHNLTVSMVHWWGWVLLVPPILMLVARAPIGMPGWFRVIALYLAAGLVLTAAHLLAVAAVEQMLERVTPGEAFGETLHNVARKRAAVGMLTFGLIVLLGHAALFHRRWREGERKRDIELMPAQAGSLPRFAVRKRSGTQLVEAADILWVEAAGNYVLLHVAGAEHMMRATLEEMSVRLGDGFARISRSNLVNLDEIASLGDRSQQGDMTVTLRSGDRLRLTRTYRSALLDRLPAAA